MGVLAKLRRGVSYETVLDLAWCAAGREPGAIRNAEDMSIDCDLHFAEHHVEDDARSLAADSGQALERSSVGGHLTAVPLEQRLGETYEILRLGVVKTDRANVRLHALDAERHDSRRRVRHGKELTGRGIDTLVSGVCGKHYRHQQLER